MIGDNIVYEPGLVSRGESANKRKYAVDNCVVDAYSKFQLINRRNLSYNTKKDAKTNDNYKELQ